MPKGHIALTSDGKRGITRAMNVKSLFYIVSGWQIPYYRLAMAQWFTFDATPHGSSDLFEKSIEIDGRGPEVVVASRRSMRQVHKIKHEVSGMVLVTPIDVHEGKDGKYVEYRGGKYGFWSRDDQERLEE